MFYDEPCVLDHGPMRTLYIYINILGEFLLSFKKNLEEHSKYYKSSLAFETSTKNLIKFHCHLFITELILNKHLIFQS